MIGAPSNRYLLVLADTVWQWADLNLQSGTYVHRSRSGSIEIDQILELAVTNEKKFVKMLRAAGMSDRLIEKRELLSPQRNAFAHSVTSFNQDGDRRLWRPARYDEPARPIRIAEMKEFVTEVKTLKTAIMSEEVKEFGRVC